VEDDCVQGAVELAVAAAAEPVLTGPSPFLDGSRDVTVLDVQWETPKGHGRVSAELVRLWFDVAKRSSSTCSYQRSSSAVRDNSAQERHLFDRALRPRPSVPAVSAAIPCSPRVRVRAVADPRMQ
jgi:hypothetical protein